MQRVIWKDQRLVGFRLAIRAADWPLLTGGHYSEVAVRTGLTVDCIMLFSVFIYLSSVSVSYCVLKLSLFLDSHNFTFIITDLFVCFFFITVCINVTVFFVGSFVCLYVCMFVCLFVCLSLCLFVCLPVCLFVCLSSFFWVIL